MAHEHVISALVEKYSQIAGKLKAAEKDVVRYKSQLSCLNDTIMLYESNFNTSTIPAKKEYRRNTPFPRGVFPRTVMDILRTASEPLSVTDLTMRALQRLGVPNPNKRILDTLRASVSSNLKQQQKKGRLVVHADGFPKKWALANPQSVASTLSIVSRQDD